MIAIRSMLFYPGYILIILLWTLSMVLISVWLPLKKRTYVCYFFYKCYEIWLLLCCNIRVSYHYESAIPAEKNYVIMANHQSSWEAFALTVLKIPSVTVLKEELIRLPLFGQALLLLKPIILQRSNLLQSMKRIYTQGVARLNEGYNLLIFPQGTRSAPNTAGFGIDKFNPSAANISLLSGFPLLLVAHNSGELLPPHKFIMYPGTIKVIVGTPLNPQGHNKASFYELALAKMDKMMHQVHSK